MDPPIDRSINQEKLKDSTPSTNEDPNLCLKLAVALALKKLQKKSSPDREEKWKCKAKERKRELLRIREELNQIEDEKQFESFSIGAGASCKCRFFDGCGVLGPRSEDADRQISEALRRRFLRHVRTKLRKEKAEDCVSHRRFSEISGGDEIEKLSTSTDFLVEHCNSASMVENDPSFAALSHQAVDFILASLKNLLLCKKENETTEMIITGLITRLVRRMCIASDKDGPNESGSEAQFLVQHLIRKMASEPYIGQRIMLSVSQKICALADSLLFMDPFDESFLDVHDCMYMMVRLLEFLISDYILTWTSNQDFDKGMFEEWVRSLLQARNALQLLEGRNVLYMMCMERVTGELAKQLGPISRQGLLDIDILSELLH